MPFKKTRYYSSIVVTRPANEGHVTAGNYGNRAPSPTCSSQPCHRSLHGCGRCQEDLNSSISNRWLRDRLEMEKIVKRKLQKSIPDIKIQPSSLAMEWKGRAFPPMCWPDSHRSGPCNTLTGCLAWLPQLRP